MRLYGSQPQIYIECAQSMRRNLTKLRNKTIDMVIDSALFAAGAAFVLTLPVISVIVKATDEENR